MGRPGQQLHQTEQPNVGFPQNCDISHLLSLLSEDRVALDIWWHLTAR